MAALPQPEAETNVVIRPSLLAAVRAVLRQIVGTRALYLRTAISVVFLFISAEALSRGRAGWVFVAFVLGAFVLTVTGGAVGICLYVLTSAVYATDGRLGAVTFGRRKDFALASVAKVVRSSLSYQLGPSTPVAFVLSPDGKRLFWVALAYWNVEELEALWRRLSIPVEGTFDSLIPYEEMDGRYPPRS